jgi:hypothetical protein
MTGSKVAIILLGNRGSGKDYAAAEVAEMTAVDVTTANIKFAAGLKHIACEATGLPPEYFESDKLKDIPLEFAVNYDLISRRLGVIPTEYYYGDTPRDFLIWLGTDVIRKFNPNWHIENALDNIPGDAKVHIYTDMRFVNEYEEVRTLYPHQFILYLARKEDADPGELELSKVIHMAIHDSTYNPEHSTFFRVDNTEITNMRNTNYLTDTLRWILNTGWKGLV